MCGIFGFITKNGSSPSLDRLRRIAVETETRGPHAFGLAWLDAKGAIHTFKRPGPVTANLDDLNQCRDAIAMIGHCRWATHGAPEDNRNNHPHQAGQGWFAHNGVVQNHASLVYRYGLRMRTECDSEVLGLLMARSSGSVGRRATQAAEVAEGQLAILGLWRNPARLLIVRNGNPLHFGETNGGFYSGSLPGELPGSVSVIRDHYVGVLAYIKNKLWHESFSISAENPKP